MVMLSINNRNLDMIELLFSIRPFYISLAMIDKAVRSQRPAILKFILSKVRPEEREGSFLRALYVSFWRNTTCHIRLVLSCLETLPKLDPVKDRTKFLMFETFRLVSVPEPVDVSSLTTLIEANNYMSGPLLTIAIKTAVGLSRLDVINSLVKWNILSEAPLYLPKISSELLSVASLTDGWDTLFKADDENGLLYSGHFLGFLEERLYCYELDAFMAALDKAPAHLKRAWARSNCTRSKAIYQLLTDVKQGDVKTLIRFMTLYPLEFGVIWYAWDLLFRSRGSDIFVRLVGCAVSGTEYA
jgi:hypothetical protein